MALFPHRAAPPDSPGVLASLKRLGASVASVLHSRVELAAREFERERVRITRLLLLGVIALFFFALGAVTFTIFIITLFWDSHRLMAIGALTLVYLAIAAGIGVFAKREAARSTKPFASTVAQLKRDREQLSSRR